MWCYKYLLLAFGCVSEMLIKRRCFYSSVSEGLWFSLVLSVISPSLLSPHFIIICLPAKISGLVGRQKLQTAVPDATVNISDQIKSSYFFSFIFYHVLQAQICCPFYNQVEDIWWCFFPPLFICPINFIEKKYVYATFFHKIKPFLKPVDWLIFDIILSTAVFSEY